MTWRSRHKKDNVLPSGCQGFGVMKCYVITSSSSPSPLGGAVACPLDDDCYTLLSSSSIISSSVQTYVTVKSTCCIRSPHLSEGGGVGSEVGVWDLQGLFFILILKNFTLLLFFVCIVITLKYCICKEET